MSNKTVLIIGTDVATNGLESGGSIRIDGIKEMLKSLDFDVQVVPRNSAQESLRKEWDLIVLVSFATAKLLRKARKSSRYIWFDPTDSWRLTRYSLIRSGQLRHIVILLRDLFWLWTAPKIDFLTFISKRDAEKEKAWWSNRLNPVIFPIEKLERTVNPSSEFRLVFVGDGNYGPNAKAVAFLTKVLQLLPSTNRVHIYGRGFGHLDSRFVLYGYSSNEEIYFENDVHLAPLTSGAGLKLKVAVPLANGLRVISTPEGANGFKQNSNLFVAPDEKSFALLILQLQAIDGVKIPIQSKDIFQDQERAKVIHWIDSKILGHP